MAAPPLQRHVAGLMRKLLAQLVADLRRLGAQVLLQGFCVSYPTTTHGINMLLRYLSSCAAWARRWFFQKCWARPSMPNAS